MKRTIVALLLLVALVAGCRAIAGEAASADITLVTLRSESSMTVKSALDLLFAGKSDSYRFEAGANADAVLPEFSYKDVPLAVAFRHILDAARLTSKTENGVQVIFPRPERQPEPPPTQVASLPAPSEPQLEQTPALADADVAPTRVVVGSAPAPAAKPASVNQPARAQSAPRYTSSSDRGRRTYAKPIGPRCPAARSVRRATASRGGVGYTYVRGHYTKAGNYVRPHFRRNPLKRARQ